MSTEIAVRQPQGGMNLPDKIQYAKALADSNLLPPQYRKQPANLLFALEYADALGVSPINAITSIHVIEGKPSASADLIASLVRRAGHRLRVSGDDTYALAQIIRADDPDFTFESRWDLGKARAAGLVNKQVWKSYPGAMLRARAITEVARAAAPDALFGVIYTPEELGAEVNGDGDVISAPSSRPEPATSAPPAQSAADRVRAGMQRRAPQPAPVAAVPDPEPEPESEPDVIDAEVVNEEPITRTQLTALNAALTVIGFTDREDKLAYLSGELGRDIGSSKELSKSEASRLIDAAKRFAAEAASEQHDEPPVEDEGWPAVVGAGVGGAH